MANRIAPMGMDAELSAKQEAKYDSELEAQAIDWIHQLTGLQCPGPKHQFYEFLKDGRVLCKLVNVLCPGAIPVINESKMAFKQMENINKFLNVIVSKLKVPAPDLFQTVDLFEEKNMMQVILTIHAVGRCAKASGYTGPTIGPRLSDKNVRDFDEEKLNAGKYMASQQMGNNKGASQIGMTAPGSRREIDHLTQKEDA